MIRPNSDPRTLKSFLILYDPAREPVEIVRILHGARDVASILG